jgi:hypothetical protein
MDVVLTHLSSMAANLCLATARLQERCASRFLQVTIADRGPTMMLVGAEDVVEYLEATHAAPVNGEASRFYYLEDNGDLAPVTRGPLLAAEELQRQTGLSVFTATLYANDRPVGTFPVAKAKPKALSHATC